MKKKNTRVHQPVLPESSPENALPYDADPVVCEAVPPRLFCNWRNLKTSLGRGWLCTVAVSSSCPTHDKKRMNYNNSAFTKLKNKYIKLCPIAQTRLI